MRRSDDDVWRALASPIRRRILDELRDGPKTTGALADHFSDLSRFAVMQHLGVLTDANLVLVRREGRQRFNFINAVPIQQIYERWVTKLASTQAMKSVGVKRRLEEREG